MSGSDTHDNFVSKHPIFAGLLFTLVLMPGIYFATDAQEKGSPTIPQMALIVVIVGPIIGYLLKYLADRRAS